MAPLANGKETDEETAQLLMPVSHGKADAGKPSGKGTPAPQFSRTKLIVFLTLYGLASSVMLVFNRAAVKYLPAPASLLALQLISTAVLAYGLKTTGAVEADSLEFGKAKAFFGVAVLFLCTIFTNIKTLQHANVNTFIVFRSSTPFLIALLDYWFLGRELPSLRSWGSLLAIFGGAFVYVMAEHGIPSVALGWACLWFTTFAVDMVYIKHIVDTVPMKPWGRVYYQNTLALPLLLVVFFIGGEYAIVGQPWDARALFVVAGSCACGAALCYTGFELRAMVSATTYTVIGIASKVASSLISAVALTEGATPLGILGLALCIIASTFYQQAPKRALLNTS
eukprot:jgi/Chlat1/3701/Chrsp251S03859